VIVGRHPAIGTCSSMYRASAHPVLLGIPETQ